MLTLPYLTSSSFSCPIVLFVRTRKQVLTSEWGHIVSHLGVVPKGHPLDLANATLGEKFDFE